MTLLRQRDNDKNDVVDVDYVCNWCGYAFTLKVRRKTGHAIGTDKKSKHKGNVSTQVKCPYCENFIKTWS